MHAVFVAVTNSTVFSNISIHCFCSVDLLLEKIYGCLKTGAVMLTIRPLEIAGKDVSGAFLRYEPNPPK